MCKSGRVMVPMARVAILLFMLLLAGCSEEKPKQAVNEMIESPLQNTVISSFDTYPPRPATQEHLGLVASIPRHHDAVAEVSLSAKSP
jgi:PBP1b-binding outer membrane lipoprotein LpoB